ncbi:MAG: glycosyltransferase family 87 protein [Tepidisphaeraceae bacterium]|jgi:hypothetical protein
MDIAYAGPNVPEPAKLAPLPRNLFARIGARIYRRLSPPPTLITFWKAGGIMFLVILTFIIGNFCIKPDKAVHRNMLGHDFLAFYYGGTCALTGHTERLYDLGETKKFEATTGKNAGLELGTSFGPWWNPPFAAWMFAPLAALPYVKALLLWWSIGALCLVISIVLLIRMLRGNWEAKALVPLLMLTTMPFIQATNHGQNTFVSLLLLTTVVTLWRARQSFLAGLVCGLLFYKPQLGMIVAIVLCITQGRRAILGVTLVGTSLLLINVLTMPGSLREFFYHMPVNLHWELEQNHYMWGRHITFKGFWRLIFQDHAEGPTAPIVLVLWGICEAALAGALLAAIAYTLTQPRSAARTDRLIAATIVSMPLLMPFYFDYDLLLISVGAVLYGVDLQRSAGDYPRQVPWEDRWLPRAWLILYIALEFAAVLAGHTRIALAPPLVAWIAVLLIRRVLRPLKTGDIHAAVRGASPMPIAA